MYAPGDGIPPMQYQAAFTCPADAPAGCVNIAANSVAVPSITTGPGSGDSTANKRFCKNDDQCPLDWDSTRMKCFNTFQNTGIAWYGSGAGALHIAGGNPGDPTAGNVLYGCTKACGTTTPITSGNAVACPTSAACTTAAGTLVDGVRSAGGFWTRMGGLCYRKAGTMNAAQTALDGATAIHGANAANPLTIATIPFRNTAGGTGWTLGANPSSTCIAGPTGGTQDQSGCVWNVLPKFSKTVDSITTVRASFCATKKLSI
jgi:hypothetical protein